MTDTAAPLVPGSISSHTSCLLIKLGQVAYRLQESALASHGLRVRHFSVLQGLADRGAMMQLDLGRYLRIDPATMVVALDQLEHRGAIERTRSPTDRRRYVVKLTDAGRQTLTELTALLDVVDRIMTTDLASADAATLQRQLGALASSQTLVRAVDRADADRTDADADADRTDRTDRK